MDSFWEKQIMREKKKKIISGELYQLNSYTLITPIPLMSLWYKNVCIMQSSKTFCNYSHLLSMVTMSLCQINIVSVQDWMWHACMYLSLSVTKVYDFMPFSVYRLPETFALCLDYVCCKYKFRNTPWYRVFTGLLIYLSWQK